MRTAVTLSIETTMALPAKPRPRKWSTMSLATVSSRSSRVISSYCCPSSARELALLLVVEVGLLDDLRQVVAEGRVDELRARDAVLVVERDRRVVRRRRREVVDRDVVAEDLLGLLLAGDQRRPGEAEEAGVRQRVAHVERERVVLGAVGLVGDDDDVVSLGEHRMRLALLGAEFWISVKT